MNPPNKRRHNFDFIDDVGELKRRSGRGASFMAISQVIQILAQFVWVVVMARLLSPSDFGLVAMVSPVLVIATIIKEMGLGQSIVQTPKLSQAEATNLYWFAMALHLVIFVVLLGCAPLIARFYGKPEVEQITIAMSFLIPIAGIGAIHDALVMRRLEFGRLAFSRTVSFLVGLPVGIALAVLWHSYWALVWTSLVQTAVAVVISWYQSGWHPGLPDRRTDIRDMMRFGRSLAVSRVMNFIATNTDNVLIGRYWGDVALGNYDRAFRLIVAPTTMITRPIAAISQTILNRLLPTPERYRRAVLALFRLMLLATVPGVTWAVASADRLIPLALGDKWGAVVPIFQALGAAAVLRFLNVMLNWLYIAEHRAKAFQNWSIFNAALIVAAVCIGLRWGPIGVASAYAFAMAAISTPLQIIQVTRGSPVRLSDMVWTVGMFAPGVLLAVAAILALDRIPALSTPVFLVAGLTSSYALAAGTVMCFSAGRKSVRQGFDLALHAVGKRGEATPTIRAGDVETLP